MDADLQAQVTQLKRNGQHINAATLLRERGHFQEAGVLFEQLFAFKDAHACFMRAGAFHQALRTAIAGGDDDGVTATIDAALVHGRADPVLVAQLEREGRTALLGRIWLANGDHQRAAQAFRDAGQYDLAANSLLLSGQIREAGLCLETHLQQQPNDLDARRSLGLLLLRFGRLDDAITLLQRPLLERTHDDDTLDRYFTSVAPALTLAFSELGYVHAAAASFDQWHALTDAHALTRDPQTSPPPTLDAFLHSERAEALREHHTSAIPTASGDGDSHAPTILSGRYWLLEPIGGDGTGETYRAHDAYTDKPVRVTAFAPHVLASEALVAFARDARAFAAMRDPLATQLIELNLAQGYCVTASSEGVAIDDQSLTRDMPRVINATLQLLDWLGRVHNHGLIHGALRPSTVLVLDATIRLLEIGAHRLLSLRATETASASAVFSYLSPEQLLGHTATASSDLYAVAAMLWRVFMGQAPVPGQAHDHVQSATRLGPGYAEFFTRGLAPSAAHRFESAEAMRSALLALPAPRIAPLSTLPPPAVVTPTQRQRYVQTAAVDACGAPFAVFAATDAVLEREVWLARSETPEALAPLRLCAGLGLGVQPVYDVESDGTVMVFARDAAQAPLDLSALRAVPQGIVRDLLNVARFLKRLHAAGFCIDGFEPERAFASVGLRMRLVPAAPLLPIAAKPAFAAELADWVSFSRLVLVAFGVPQSNQTPRHALVQHLRQTRVIDEATAPLSDENDWVVFLEGLHAQLLDNAPARAVAKIVAGFLAPTDP